MKRKIFEYLALLAYDSLDKGMYRTVTLLPECLYALAARDILLNWRK